MKRLALLLLILGAGAVPASAAEPGTGSVSQAGVATWCAPTPTHCHGWGGKALLGAVSGYQGTPFSARVCRRDRPKVCVVVRIVSTCGCGLRHGESTVVDLSPYAFRRLAPQSRGVVKVVYTSPVVELPPTDAANAVAIGPGLVPGAFLLAASLLGFAAGMWKLEGKRP